MVAKHGGIPTLFGDLSPQLLLLKCGLKAGCNQTNGDPLCTFIDDVEDVIECAFITFSEDANLGGVTDSLEGRMRIPSGLDKLGKKP